ncbi:hypothetical protein BD324DRAFT_194161 [Kockovaella imperatae]|uniref:Zn(2)-C6 fungal-type domain-containing protein n=1 Tax=Kockovaella imperatae TaxID=4999 RepID=A0A1Y1U7P2_9TREE|nr:hypothetical protein BD324DRAFT_194161 [Kockovaella imperatae]ORX34050.1 hypothetical protein BD324DRAFT_194161 [Kockovaella imperatae]
MREMATPARSRKGCMTCRRTRVKCDERRPICGRCLARTATCVYNEDPSPQRHRVQRPIASCISCRRRKIKCIGTGICQNCSAKGEPCSNATPMAQPAASLVDPSGLFPFPPVVLGGQSESQRSTSTVDLRPYLMSFFRTVNHFVTLGYIHEGDFWQQHAIQAAPSTLSRIMAANAIRFGDIPATSADLSMADEWAAEVGDKMINLATTEFGALELMQIILCQHYDFHTGRYTRGYVMAGMAARMMTFLRLHMLDERQPPPLLPLLSLGSLRRLAWAVWHLDATLDGGKFGFSSIAENALTLLLPGGIRDYLELREEACHSMTEGHHDTSLEAHLIRALSARQILASLHTRIARNLVPLDEIPELVDRAVDQAERLLQAPFDFVNPDVEFIKYRDQLPLLVSVHAMRNTARRHIHLLYILIGKTRPHRHNLVQEVEELCKLLTHALLRSIPLDPQIAMHAYNGIEVLLFQPLRLQLESGEEIISREAISSLIEPLLRCIRSAAGQSTLVALIHPEAVNRLLLRGFTEHLIGHDWHAVLRKLLALSSCHLETHRPGS